MYRGVWINSPNTPGVEGVQLSVGQIIGCFQGIYGISANGSPGLTLAQIGINAMGGECLYLDGFQQVSFGVGNLFYSNLGANGAPARAIYLNNATAYDGRIKLITFQNTAYGVEMAGAGGAIDLDISLISESRQTQPILVPAGYASSPPVIGIDHTWSGNTTWGGTLTAAPAPTANYRRKLNYVDAGSAFPLLTNGALLQWTGQKWTAVSGLSANPDFARLVQGDFASSRAKRITSITPDLPSGFYTMVGSAGMPADATGFNQWLVVVTRNENGSGTGDRWSAITAVNMKSKLTYTAGWDVQAGALTSWMLQMGTADAPVAGDLFYHDGTKLVRIPKGTNGQFLKMVSGLPAWSN